MSQKKEKTEKEPADFWEKLSPAKKHAFCLGFLFILPVVLFHASVLGGQQYMGHDTIQWRAGAESLFEHQETYDEPAHWASNMFSGMPATTVSHPPKISNLDNTVLRWLRFIYPAAEFWILLGGACLMFLLMGSKPLSAVFGAVLIGFTTYIPIIIGAGHNAKFLAYIYIPWLYSGYFLITRSERNRWLSFFVFALALTLHLRAYHPQVTYFFLFPLGTLFICDAVKAVRSVRTKPFVLHTAWLLGAAVIALLVTAQLYWSTLEYSAFSMRGGSEVTGAGGLSRDYAFAWSQGWSELLTLIIPGAFGGSELYWGPKSSTAGPHYFGAAALLFFVIGIIKGKHPLKWVFLGPGIVTLLFSLGEHFGALNNAMFAFFPLFDKFRVPEMWLMVTLFCFAPVAVMGMDFVTGAIRRSPGFTAVQKPLLVAAGIAVVAVLIGFQGLSYEKAGERTAIAQQIAAQNNVPADDPRVTQTVSRYIQTELIPGREELARGDTLRFAFIFVLAAGILWVMGAGKVSISAGMLALCFITAYDLISVDGQYLSERSLVDQDITREQHIEQTGRDIDRFLSEHVSSGEGWNYRVLPLLDNPFNNAIPAYFYPSAGGYSGAKLGYYQDLMDEAFFSGPAGINTGVLNMLNIRYLTVQSPIDAPGFETVYEGEDGVVIENMPVLPKAFYVDSVEVLAGQPSVLQRISEDFDPSSVAYITRDPALDIRPDTTASVTVAEYSANAITLELSRSEPGFLVLSEIWYPPGWTATLDGEETDIIRTNYVLRGFEIPAGEHTLEMTLEPVWYRTGNRLAFIGTVLLFGSGILGVVLGFRRREKED